MSSLFLNPNLPARVPCEGATVSAGVRMDRARETRLHARVVLPLSAPAPGPLRVGSRSRLRRRRRQGREGVGYVDGMEGTVMMGNRGQRQPPCLDLASNAIG